MIMDREANFDPYYAGLFKSSLPSLPSPVQTQHDQRRPALHRQTESESNSSALAAIRMVPKTPPRLLGQTDADDAYYYSRTPLPTCHSHSLDLRATTGTETETETGETVSGIENVTGRDGRKEKDKGNGPSKGASFGIGIGMSMGMGIGKAKRKTGLGARTSAAALDYDSVEFHQTGANFKSSGSGPPLLGLGVSSTSTPSLAGSAVSPTAATPTPSPIFPTSPSLHTKPLTRKRQLYIHDDNKTFSLLHSLDDDRSKSPSSASISLASTHTSSHLSSLANKTAAYNAKAHKNSTALCTPAGILTTDPATTPRSDQAQSPISADNISSSPWNYHFIGGVRKVAKTPDRKGKAADTYKESPLPPIPPRSDDLSLISHDISPQHSFHSDESSCSEKTNYHTYHARQHSPHSLTRSTSDTGDQKYIDSSPVSSVKHRPVTENETRKEASSPARPNIDILPHPKSARESLIIRPLKTLTRRPNEHVTPKSKQRESFRSASFNSISTIFSHREALRAIVGSGSIVQLPTPTAQQSSNTSGTSSWAPDPSLLHPPRLHMNEQPHQWSSQLSTVLSVSESGTDRGSWSADNSRSRGSISSRGGRSRVLSFSSGPESAILMSRSQSRSGDSMIEAPYPTFFRPPRHNSTSSIGIIAEPDEYGDGITDMTDLRPRQMRRRMSGYYSSTSSENGRTNTMRSSASTRANSIISIPTWARLYYGSGERRHLGWTGSSTDGSDSRANSFRTQSFRSGSLNTNHFPVIHSPRRRPREIDQNRRGSLEINTAPPQFSSDGQLNNGPYQRRYRTWSMSSLWSPHLRQDRRAVRPSMWDPPSVSWSTEGGVFGKRNIQIVMFIMGFIFPFAWMISSFLPLPPKPQPLRDMRELDNGWSNPYREIYNPVEEARYESALWWRKLNGCMSFLGILIVASVIVLVVVGIKQGWGTYHAP